MRIIMIVTLCLAGWQGTGQAQPDQVQEMLWLLRKGEPDQARTLLDELKDWDQKALWDSLRDESVAKAFWINLYNATVQLLLTEDPSRFVDREDFFGTEWISVAGQRLSLDFIEHGIIRSSKHMYTLGYTEKLFVGDFEEKFRLGKVDYRVHFALNCGAKSCPPVAIYRPETLDSQLDEGSRRYLRQEVAYDRTANEIYVPMLCFWFHGDFGGDDGIRRMLVRYGFDREFRHDPDIEYLEYDWTLQTGHYIDL